VNGGILSLNQDSVFEDADTGLGTPGPVVDPLAGGRDEQASESAVRQLDADVQQQPGAASTAPDVDAAVDEVFAGALPAQQTDAQAGQLSQVGQLEAQAESQAVTPMQTPLQQLTTPQLAEPTVLEPQIEEPTQPMTPSYPTVDVPTGQLRRPRSDKSFTQDGDSLSEGELDEVWDTGIAQSFDEAFGQGVADDTVADFNTPFEDDDLNDIAGF